MKIYNTLSKKIEDFIPRQDKNVNMFVCGPTVYDYVHFGNARTFTFFDLVAKYLRFRGYNVNYVQNITDIDDKIITRAKESGLDPIELANDFKNAFHKDMKTLGNDAVTKHASATEYIPEVIKQVKTLIDKGYAYLIAGDGWYFDLTTFPEYGKLSGRTSLGKDDAVSRIDDNPAKRNKGDFCLWKLSKPVEPSWDSELGPGRPGWHIEDTAITEHFFGPQYDLHGGGQDLIFPHHEAEITQQESASGLKPFVKYWMHAGFLINKDRKISKSLGNFSTVHELLEKYSKEVLRFYLLSGHYRSPLDYNDQILMQSEAAICRISEFINRLRNIKADGDDLFTDKISSLLMALTRALDDDFNTPLAIGTLFTFIRETNIAIDEQKFGFAAAQKIIDILHGLNSFFGFISSAQIIIPDNIQVLVSKREILRQHKDFTGADNLRQEIYSAGWVIEDTGYGPLVKKVSSE